VVDLSNIVQNNLGGAGPDSGAEEIRYKNAINLDGRLIDVVLKAVTPYQTQNNFNNGHNGATPEPFGQFTMATGTTSDLKFEFQDAESGALVAVPNLALTFYDLDESKFHALHGTQKETVTVCSAAEVYVTEDTELVYGAEGECRSVTSSTRGTGKDDPTTPSELTKTQAARSVTYEFHARSHIFWTATITSRRTWPRSLLFSFRPQVACGASDSETQCKDWVPPSDLSNMRNPNALALPPKGAQPWRLALNIDTNDGNAVNYANEAFWESGTELGGASGNEDDAFTQDYKNLEVFNDGQVTEILVVVHDEGEMLGWRRWRATGDHSSLHDYFTAGNTCKESSPSLANSVHLAAETIDAETGQLDPHEPLVVNTAGGSVQKSTTDLWINSGGDHNSHNDFNRLSTVQIAPSNAGWGLGTVYDLQTNGWSLCGTPTMRPQADAQFHADQNHWGSKGGIGGLIGTDHICHDGSVSCPEGRCSQCPWTVVSGINYDYAIFIS
jgi:hypothetical protein